MRTPSPRVASVAKWAAVPVSLLVSSALVWQGSYAAFSAQTDNPASNWTAGTVALSDDDSNTALFTASDLTPGATGTKCIVVTSSGDLPSAVKLYATGAATTKSLSSYIDLSIDEGTGGSFATSGPTSCTGFTPLATGANAFTGTLAAFGSTKTDYATGVGSFAPTGGTAQSRTYRVTYTLSASTPNSAQGGTASVAFTWEAQNT